MLFSFRSRRRRRLLAFETMLRPGSALSTAIRTIGTPGINCWFVLVMRKQAGNIPACSQYLLSDTELCYAGSVTLNVNLSQIVKETAALTYHLEKTKTAVVVFLVDLKVLCQLGDRCV